MASFSVLIRGGKIIDGTGSNKLYQADVGIRDDRIFEIGNLSSSKGELEIDALGKYVVPGFIDLTNHSDTHWTIFDFPGQESMITQGITTVLGGNCGTSLAPLVSGNEIEAIKKWVDTSEINVSWQGLGEFLDQLEKNGLGVNFATLVGFGTLRRDAVRKAEREADSTEIEKMRFLLEESMAAGAFGLSTSLGRAHEQMAGSQELSALAEIVAASGGLVKHHLRDEGPNIMPALSETVSIARNTGVKTSISHFKVLGKGSWPHFNSAVVMIEQALKDQLPITLDVFPYTSTGSDLYLLLPEWALAGGRDSILKNISDEMVRRDIMAELAARTLHYDNIIIANTLRDPTPIGKTIADIAASSGFTPEDVILEMLAINDLQVGIFNEVIHQPHLDALAHKFYVHFATDGFGLSAGARSHELPHPRSFGTTTKALNYFTKIRAHLSWEEAIYKMSGMPAGIAGFKNRGTILKNSFADIVVLDPDRVSDLATYANPLQYSSGIEWVLINGKAAVKNGEIAGGLFGRVLRKSR